jgi:zinc transporter
LHLDYAAYATKEWLFHDSGLDVTVAETLMSAESRPRFNSMDSGEIFAWRGVNEKPKNDDDDLMAIRLWKDEQRLISSLHRGLQAVDVAVSALLKGRGAKTLGELMVSIADAMVWEITHLIDSIEDQMSELEALVIDEGKITLRTDISSLRRRVIALRRYIAPQKEALMRFSTERLKWLDMDSRMELREVVDRVTRGLEDLEAIRERAAVAQEELQNKISEPLNNRMYVLSIITAIFLPLGFLTGLLGINVGGIPGSENPEAFRYFVISGVILIIVQLILFKWRKWF